VYGAIKPFKIDFVGIALIILLLLSTSELPNLKSLSLRYD
jgi:hypothetical protein